MKRRVFFVGAGFSKALCPQYPTLAELSKIVAANFCSRHQSGAIREHYNQLPPGLIADVEKLLSYLYSDWPWKSSIDRDMDRALYKALTYEIYIHLTSIVPQSLPEAYQQFVRFINNENNQVITLNYDTLIQHLHSQYSLIKGEHYSRLLLFIEDDFDEEQKTSPDKPWFIEEVHGEEYIAKKLTIQRNFIAKISPAGFKKLIESTESAIWASNPPEKILGKYQVPPMHQSNPLDTTFHKRIIKLHGSVAWKENSSESSIRVFDSDGNPKWDHTPTIVPPVLDKSQHYATDRLKEQWANAHLALEQADEIVIIGFSFPATDVSCQFLFQSALKSRKNVRIVVVNSDSHIRNRYDPIFRGLTGIYLDYAYSGCDSAFMHYIEHDVLRRRS